MNRNHNSNMALCYFSLEVDSVFFLSLYSRSSMFKLSSVCLLQANLQEPQKPPFFLSFFLTFSFFFVEAMWVPSKEAITRHHRVPLRLTQRRNELDSTARKAFKNDSDPSAAVATSCIPVREASSEPLTLNLPTGWGSETVMDCR